MPRTLLALLFTTLLFSASGLQANVDSTPPQVTLLGVFHFANPGRDVVKTNIIDIKQPPHQAYLVELSAALAERKPKAVLIECSEEMEEGLNQEYQAYLADTFELGYNENYQLGFRVAKLAGLDRLTCYDEQGIHWQGAPLMAHLQTNKGNYADFFHSQIEAYQQGSEARHQAGDLGNILIYNNLPESDSANRGFYLGLNPVGDADKTDAAFLGADAAASWWHRNFRMYARIQRAAKQYGDVLVIGGAGHTAVFRTLVRDDPWLQEAPVMPLLEAL